MLIVSYFTTLMVIYCPYGNDGVGSFRLLDGDKIAGLAAMYIKDLIKTAGLDLRLGVVQTAYANGNSTAYMKHQLVTALIVRLYLFIR